MKSFVFPLLLAAMPAFSTHAAPLSEADKAAVQINLRQNIAAEYVATVDLGTQRYRFTTHIPDFQSDPEAIARERKMMGWKGDYLFVRQRCAAAAEWRCVVDQVFTRKGDALVHLGSVESARCETPGCAYDDGMFNDLYDGLQVNPVSGRVDTPPLRIARRESEGKLVTDLDRTWQLNQPAYLAALACLDKVAKDGFTSPCENRQAPWSALVFAAKLTHYTGRAAEREGLFARQVPGYCARSADTGCAKRVAGVKDFFSRFPAGDAPQFTPYPVTATQTSDENSKPKAEKFETGKTIRLKL